MTLPNSVNMNSTEETTSTFFLTKIETQLSFFFFLKKNSIE